MHGTRTETHPSYTKYKPAYSFALVAKQTNRDTPTHTQTHTHKNQPLGGKFHFISRAGKEQAGESIHAISSCAEGDFAAMETDVALLQTAALIQ